jgi:hypothetical protein
VLKDKEYEAIGRLALAFNEVETVIDEYCPHILGASEWGVATALWDKKAGFDRKADRFASIVTAIAEHYGPLKGFTDPIIELLKSAKTLADKRNQYVHAVVFVNYEKNETLMMVRGNAQPCDEVGIRTLATEAVNLADRLEQHAAELVGHLIDLRKPAIPAALKVDYET